MSVRLLSKGECYSSRLTDYTDSHLELSTPVLFDLPDLEIDEAHVEHVKGDEGEGIFLGVVIDLEALPGEGYLWVTYTGASVDTVHQFAGVMTEPCRREQGYGVGGRHPGEQS